MGKAGGAPDLRLVDPFEKAEVRQEGAGAEVVDIRGDVQEGFWKVSMQEYMSIVKASLERTMTQEEEQDRERILSKRGETD